MSSSEKPLPSGMGHVTHGSVPTQAQAQVLSDYAQAAQGVRAAFARWPEASLDTHALPHDLLGRVSVRELMFFVLYHDHHHLNGAQSVLAQK